MKRIRQLARRGTPLFAVSWLMFVLLTALQPCCDTVAEASSHHHDAVAQSNPDHHHHGLQQPHESGHPHCDIFSQWQASNISAVAVNIEQPEAPDFILSSIIEPPLPLLYTKQKNDYPLLWMTESSPPVFLVTQRLRI